MFFKIVYFFSGQIQIINYVINCFNRSLEIARAENDEKERVKVSYG